MLGKKGYKMYDIHREHFKKKLHLSDIGLVKAC